MNREELLNLPVKSVMTTELFIAKPDTILKEVKSLLDKENIHHVPVIDDESRFVGMISRSDILLLMDWGSKFKIPSSERQNIFMLTSNLAKDLMETNCITVSPDDTVEKCVHIFRENFFRAMPVIDENGILVGIITTYDLLMLAYSPQFSLNPSNN